MALSWQAAWEDKVSENVVSTANNKAVAKIANRNTVFENCVELVCWKTVPSRCVPTPSSFAVLKLFWSKHCVALGAMNSHLELGQRH